MRRKKQENAVKINWCALPAPHFKFSLQPLAFSLPNASGLFEANCGKMRLLTNYASRPKLLRCCIKKSDTRLAPPWSPEFIEASRSKQKLATDFATGLVEEFCRKMKFVTDFTGTKKSPGRKTRI